MLPSMATQLLCICASRSVNDGAQLVRLQIFQMVIRSTSDLKRFERLSNGILCELDAIRRA